MQFDDLELSTSYIDDELSIIANGAATEPELFPENADAANKKVFTLFPYTTLFRSRKSVV